MEVGDKLKELNMTGDEIDRLTRALKEEKFGEMLRNYAHELSDPENKTRYEEEIKLLEKERGNTIEFIHPKPFRSLRTSVNGKQKCFINICASEKVGKPECKCGVSEDGRRGQCWSLPHSLHPGRQDTDPKGNKIMIYDVIFHPDTVHIASKNKRFMDTVDSTAIQGIQDAFKVTLDKNNVREMSTKYKGAPQPCVIRKPIPGYKSKEPSEVPDPLAFPYPDEKRPTASLQMKPTESPATQNSGDAEPKSYSIQPEKVREPTKPNYTVKYRSFVDLQDFRCSRDSAQSPRPKEIVVTIAVPLLKAASDASLEVKERQLLLASKKPAYRLELPLAYPVDEDKGEAKFNKQRGQLTVTLSVLPSDEAFDLSGGSAQTGVSDDEIEEEKREVDEEEREEEERESKKSEEEQIAVEEDFRQQTRVEKVEKEGETGHEKGEEQMRADNEGVVGEKETWEGENGDEEEKIGLGEEAKWEKQNGKGQEGVDEILKKQKKENETEVGKSNLQKRQQLEDNEDSGLSFQWDTVGVSLPDHNRLVATPETDNQLVLIPAEHLSCEEKEGEVHLNSCSESPSEMKTSDIKEETAETDAAFLNHRSSEESQTSRSAEPHSQNNTKDFSDGVTEEPAVGSVKQVQRENIDQDDRPTVQIFHKPEHDTKPPPVFLREIDKDGNEKIISDHSTSAGFIFQNSLMYELD
ncbi:protein kintoun [Anarrhichthys ocellatus]|uniref:protein kintoun n=1 Tax=Anarrhichthys ocellatus TaxID=433405 RepID=UPI0012EE24CA|nr:protein kintoun [Anarrhichthys ocellatus]